MQQKHDQQRCEQLVQRGIFEASTDIKADWKYTVQAFLTMVTDWNKNENDDILNICISTVPSVHLL